MKSIAVKWLLKIEKYSSLGEYNRAAWGLLSLSAHLKGVTVVPEDLKTDVILKLKKLLLSESTTVVRRTIDLLAALTNEFSDLPSELTLALMKQANIVLHSCGAKLNKHGTLICEMLTDLTWSYMEKNMKMLHLSGCLQVILSIFNRFDMSEISLEELNWLGNILISAATDEASRIEIGQTVIPKVLNCLNIWLNNDDPPAAMNIVIKELLFLCRNVITAFKDCQNMFIEHGGLESLLRALKMDVMRDHLEIEFPQRLCIHIDISPTLFSSLVILLDVVVTHNVRACQRALKLDAIDILRQYIPHAPSGQQVFILETIGHLLETEIIPRPSFIEDILKATKSPNLLQCLTTPQKKQTKIKGTPHPKKKLSLKKCDAAFSRTNSSLKKSLKRLGSQASEQSTSKVESPRQKFHDPLPVSPENSCSLAHPLQERDLSAKPQKYRFSIAELVLLMQCVSVHGVNMHEIRDAFPFHKELTPADLYATWRSIWRK